MWFFAALRRSGKVLLWGGFAVAVFQYVEWFIFHEWSNLTLQALWHWFAAAPPDFADPMIQSAIHWVLRLPLAPASMILGLILYVAGLPGRPRRPKGPMLRKR